MKIKISICLLTIICFAGCRSFVEVPPPRTETDIATVFSDDMTAKAAILGIYQSLSFSGAYISRYVGLSADEYDRSEDNRDQQFYQNGLLADNVVIKDFWVDSYRAIYMANAILEGIQQSAGVTAPVKQMLEGEAKFSRAFLHFTLVNMFGNIAYITTTDYRVNNVAIRMPAADVYAAIVKDLQEAKELLLPEYPTAGRLRPNRAAATALLARAQLYSHEWADAEAQATLVIDQRDRYKFETDLNNVFLKNSQEAIWQLMPASYMKYTMEGSMFVNRYSNNYGTIPASLLQAFEPGDQRAQKWIEYVDYGTVAWEAPYKYKENYENPNSSEYSMVMRLAEQYLIRAEARAMQGKLTGPNSAASDIDSIRVRAGLQPTTATMQTQLLTAVEQERRLELFLEWGHRWFDLKRTKRADAVLGAIKPNWTSNDTLFPVPQYEIFANPNIKQNKGYQ